MWTWRRERVNVMCDGDKNVQKESKIYNIKFKKRKKDRKYKGYKWLDIYVLTRQPGLHGYGFWRVQNIQPIPIPVTTHHVNPRGLTNP
jgi:hypothetical protein